MDETNKITVDENVNPKGVTQKQPLEVLYQKMCSWKFRKIHRKTPVPESLF